MSKIEPHRILHVWQHKHNPDGEIGLNDTWTTRISLVFTPDILQELIAEASAEPGISKRTLTLGHNREDQIVVTIHVTDAPEDARKTVADCVREPGWYLDSVSV